MNLRMAKISLVGQKRWDIKEKVYDRASSK